MRNVMTAALVAAVLAAGVARADWSCSCAALIFASSARETLKGAGSGFGGHKDRALEHINHALEELKQAQNVDTRKDAKAEKKVQNLEKKDQHLQQRIDNMKNKAAQ